MPICKDRKLLFIHIPKCAGSTIEEKVFGINTNDASPDISKLWGVYRTNQCDKFIELQLQHLTFKEIELLWLFQIQKFDYDINEFTRDYTFFTVVRNPYDRLLSEYTWIQKVFPEISDISFEEYVDNLDTIYDNSFKCHIIPQYDMINGYDKYQWKDVHILHFENFITEFNLMSNRVDGIDKIDNVKYNTTKHSNYRDFYPNISDSTIDKIYNRYEIDFEIFGYRGDMWYEKLL